VVFIFGAFFTPPQYSVFGVLIVVFQGHDLLL